MPIKALLFDFDGVVLDSLDVKTKAFFDMYLPYGEEIAKKVMVHHLAHGGISRFEKFKFYHEHFLGKIITQQEINGLADEFSDRVLKGVISSPEVKGIRTFLKNNHTKYRCWIITGTPTHEIKLIAEACGLTPYFVEMYGSPEKKDFWTKKILHEQGLLPEEVVFIGDATTDYEAAITNKVHFILREHEDNLIYFKDKSNIIRIKDFTSFEQLLLTVFN